MFLFWKPYTFLKIDLLSDRSYVNLKFTILACLVHFVRSYHVTWLVKETVSVISSDPPSKGGITDQNGTLTSFLWREKKQIRIQKKFKLENESIFHNILQIKVSRTPLWLGHWRVTWNYAYSPFNESKDLNPEKYIENLKKI